MSEKIYIFDTTLRDGEQTPRVSLNSNEKMKIAKALSELRVDAIEAGFSAVSDGDFENVSTIASNIKGVTITALARATKGDIDAAWNSLKNAEKPRIHTFIATSPIHRQYKLKMSKEEVLKRAIDAVKYAKSYCDDIEFSAEDASRTEPEFLYEVLKSVIDAGATVVNIPDTVGYTTPIEYGKFIKSIKENVPNIDKAIISVHCHNDLGMAVANSLSAIENGARQIECAINGLGERAGNAALEEIVMALKTRKDYYNIETNIKTKEISKVSNLVKDLSGVIIQPNKAIVGANAFAHESGIHQHGVLNNKETYEIMTPESIGFDLGSTLVLGKHSGRHAFEEKLKELGYENLPAEKINCAFKKFKDLADKKKTVSTKDIDAIFREDQVRLKETYKLESALICTGTSIISTSTIKIRKGDEVILETGCADGSVNATFRAIEKAVGFQIELTDYRLDAVTEGIDALGEVRVRIKRDGKYYSGYGNHIDIVQASAKAFVNAINRSVGA